MIRWIHEKQNVNRSSRKKLPRKTVVVIVSDNKSYNVNIRKVYDVVSDISWIKME